MTSLIGKFVQSMGEERGKYTGNQKLYKIIILLPQRTYRRGGDLIRLLTPFASTFPKGEAFENVEDFHVLSIPFSLEK